MASWFGGLSSSLGGCLGQMRHSVVSFTRHISRCTKDVWMTEYKTEESNELRRKEVETSKETIRPKVERFMTFCSDLDLENKQETAAYSDLLIKGDLDIKLFIEKEILVTHKLQNLQANTQSVNVAAGFVPAISSALPGENIDPKASEYKHGREPSKNLEMRILREQHGAMNCKFLKLQKATESINVTTSLVPATPAMISPGDNIDHNASEYEHQLEDQNLEVKILRGRNVAMKPKLLKLQKATECLNVAADLLPATSSASLGENINPNISEYKYELEQKNLEVKILRERHKAMERKLLKLQNATRSINTTAGLVAATPASASLGDNIDHSACEYKIQLEEQNLAMKILRGRNVAMKHKLLKLEKATECLNVAAGLLPAMSSTSLGENINPNASEYKHELEQKDREVKILRGRNVVMKHQLLKLRKATPSLSVAAGPVSATPASISLAENIDHNACEYKNQLEQQNLEMKILRGRNVAMRHKLLKLLKATHCLNMAAGLILTTSSTSLGKNIDRNASECKHQLKQKNLKKKILRERHGAVTPKRLKLENATESINTAAGLVAATPASTSLAENIDHNACEYKNQLEQQNLEMKILRGRNVAMKHKLIKLQKATECLNVAAGLLPAMSSASLGENINPNASEHKHELEQKDREVKILRGRNVVMKHKLLNLQKATRCLNVAAGLIPAMPVMTSLGDSVNHNASEYKNQLKQENLEMKILRGRNIAMKHKLLNLQKATQCLNEAAGLVLATPVTSLGENINPNASEYKHQLEQKNLEMKILRERHAAMKRKLFNLQKATESINAAAGLLPATSSTSLGENINPNAFECKHCLEEKNLEMKILRERHGAMKHTFLKLENSTESINLAASLVSGTSPSTSLSGNTDHSISEYEHELKQQNLEMKILRGRNVAMKPKLLKLQKATESINVASGLLPVTSSTSLGENINPNASVYKYELEQKNLEVKILRERHEAMERKLLKLQNATRSINTTAGLVAATSTSASQGNNIDHSACEYKIQLEEQNLAMKILRGRNVAMKHKLLKLEKATECLNVAAGLLPATSSASLGENINPNASEYKHELEQKDREVKILRGRNVVMKHQLLKLRKATPSLSVAAGPVSATPASTSLAENIDHNACEYKNQLEQQNLEMKILRGRNVAMKHKLLKLLKATHCLNVAAGLVLTTSSTSLGENIDPKASEHKHEVKQKNLEMWILRERHGTMKHKLLNLQNATESMNLAAGLIPAIPPSTSLGDNIDHNASEYEHQLEEQNLEMKILRRRNVAMKHKLLKLEKATESINAAAGLLPVTSSASLGEKINPNASEYEHELEQKDREVKILRGRNVAMKHQLLNLQKASESINMAAGLILAIPASTSLGDNIDHNASEYKNQLEQQNLEMKILRGRNVAMKHKLLKLLKATHCLNVAAGLLPATSSTSLGENINLSVSEYKHQLEDKNLEVKILRETHAVMKHELLKLQKGTESLNVAAGLVPAMPASTSLGDNIDHNASEYHRQLKLKNINHHASSIYQHLPEQNDLVDVVKSISKIF